MNLSIKANNFELDDDIREAIESKIAPLDKYYGNIIMAELQIERVSNHHKKGDLFRAELNIEVPEIKKVLRSESTKETIDEALVEVKDWMQRELKKYKEKKQLEPRRHGAMIKEKLRDMVVEGEVRE